MERDFLLYLIFSAFLEIRVRSVEIYDDMISFDLCSLNHNIPLALVLQNNDKKAYADFFAKSKIQKGKIGLKCQLSGFAKEYPPYRDDFLVLENIKNQHYTTFFLLYILHISLIDLKAISYNNNDKISYKICNLMANVPLQLIENEDGKKSYNLLIENVEFLGMHPWLANRKREFSSRYPKYNMR